MYKRKIYGELLERNSGKAVALVALSAVLVACRTTPGRGFEVTAHAGAGNTPANTVESLRTLAAANVDCLEVDVSFRSNGTAVIVHKAHPSDAEGVPLADALRVVAASDKRLNLDLKRHEPELLKTLPALVDAAGLRARVFFTGVGAGQVEAVRTACPGIPYYLNCTPPATDEAADRLVETIVRLGAVGANPDYRKVTPDFARRLHERGLKLSVWTARSPKTFAACAALSPDNVTTLWLP